MKFTVNSKYEVISESEGTHTFIGLTTHSSSSTVSSIRGSGAGSFGRGGPNSESDIFPSSFAFGLKIRVQKWVKN